MSPGVPMSRSMRDFVLKATSEGRSRPFATAPVSFSVAKEACRATSPPKPNSEADGKDGGVLVPLADEKSGVDNLLDPLRGPEVSFGTRAPSSPTVAN